MNNIEWFKGYDSRTFFDEVFNEDGLVRESYRDIVERFKAFNAPEILRRKDHCELSFRNQGITFAVTGDPLATERTFPFDFFPRVIAADEWKMIEKGLIQRVKALNIFLYDIYHEQDILGTGIVPARMVLGHPAFRREVHGIDLPFQTYTHVAGVDLVKDEKGNYLVLEDNLRIPSGASYMLANRGVMARIFPQMIAGRGVQLTQAYPDMLLDMLSRLSPRDVEKPNVVLLTPGPFNSAYFEHLFLAQQMGIELVEGQDLYVDEGRVWMKTTQGRQQVDVIYRRVDEEFLDPVQFRSDSILGVRGLVEVYRQGRVALANAIGTGVADDKAIYTFVPDIIRFYLGEEPILSNVPTFMGERPEELDYIIKNAAELVIKRVDGAGGYGMLIGPHSTKTEIEVFLESVKADPTGYIAQPVIALSTHPTWVPEKNIFQPRHLDLRPFVLSGETIQVVPGGLTRVALREGSLVVNSSQGGGSKDTWVLGDPSC